jgi:hypothetical protein
LLVKNHFAIDKAKHVAGVGIRHAFTDINVQLTLLKHWGESGSVHILLRDNFT